jgi:RNA polymerase sigma-70 factor (ECF subfamily)
VHNTPISDPAIAVQPGAGEDDLALARRVAGGDRLAFEQVMRRHNRRLYRLARATLRNDAEAEDALQEAYLAAYRAMDRFRGDASMATWLSRLVLNECLARQRRQARRDNILPILGSPALDLEEASVMDAPGNPSPDEALGRSEIRALIERRLDELPEAFRQVFVLRCVEELSVEETARCLAIPEATVRSRHFRARSLLRESLTRDIDLAQADVFSFGGVHFDRMVDAVMQRLLASKALHS